MPYSGRVLVVSDSDTERRGLTEHLRGQGFVAYATASSDTVLGSASGEIDVVVVAISNSEAATRSAVSMWLARSPAARLVVLVDESAKQFGLDAIAYGAFDLLTRPINWTEAGFVVLRAWRDLQNARELLDLRRRVSHAAPTTTGLADHRIDARDNDADAPDHRETSSEVRDALAAIHSRAPGVVTPIDLPVPQTAPADPRPLHDAASASQASHAATITATATYVPSQLPMGLSLEDIERIVITRTLNHLHGNRTHTAQKLGISVRTLQRKIRQYELASQLQPPPFQQPPV